MYAALHFRTTTGQHSKGMIYCQTGYTRYIHGIYHVYTAHIPCDGHLRARLVAHPRLEASDRDFRRSFSVLATERPPMRGWGRPKFHNQVLISQTWVHLREFGPAPSAQPHFNLKVSLRWLPVLCLCGIVEVAFLSIKHGMMEEFHPSV